MEAAPKGSLIQCRIKQEKDPIVGIRSEIFDHFANKQVAGAILLEGSQKGIFIKRGQFYGSGAFDVSSLISPNVILSPRTNMLPQRGFLYFDPHSKAVWMWSELGDMVGWYACTLPAP